MKQLKIGIIGAGRIGSLHAKSITYNVPTATVVGITDVFSANAEKVAAELNIPVIYDDYKQMLADPNVEAVLICSSTDTHADIAIEAAEAGKHIFCEKPVDLTPEKVKAVTAAVTTTLQTSELWSPTARSATSTSSKSPRGIPLPRRQSIRQSAAVCSSI